MATNERVSQLLELFATDIQSEDLLLITDMSQRESKKVEMGQLLLFIENSGSFESSDALHADTASFILAQNIYGVVPISKIASSSISSSWTAHIDTSSYSITSSFSNIANSVITNPTNAITTSFINYTGVPNGSSSYSLRSGISDNSVTSFNLFYNGQPNGTASWAINSITSSLSLNCLTSSVSNFSLNTNSSSYAQTSSFANLANGIIGGVSTPIKAWSSVTWSMGVTLPQLYINYNVSSVKWLNRFILSGSQLNYDQFSIQFTNPLGNINYVLIGNAQQAYTSQSLNPHVFIHPFYGNKTTSSFTMSVVTSTLNDFYTTVSGSYPNDIRGWANFEILGV